VHGRPAARQRRLRDLATDAAPGFTLRTFDLSAYAGQTVTLRFSGTEDDSLQTSFVIGDASLSTSSRTC
jgi:hypothetical protein